MVWIAIGVVVILIFLTVWSRRVRAQREIEQHRIEPEELHALLAVNRGLVATGVPVGGLPQSGGHMNRADGFVTTADRPTSAAATTAMAIPQVAASRRCDVFCSGVAV